MQKTYAVTHSDAEWRRILTPEQYHIMREHGTEAPGSCAVTWIVGKSTCGNSLTGRRFVREPPLENRAMAPAYGRNGAGRNFSGKA